VASHCAAILIAFFNTIPIVAIYHGLGPHSGGKTKDKPSKNQKADYYLSHFHFNGISPTLIKAK
jgi:hypothetical protein